MLAVLMRTNLRFLCHGCRMQNLNIIIFSSGLNSGYIIECQHIRNRRQQPVNIKVINVQMGSET